MCIVVTQKWTAKLWHEICSPNIFSEAARTPVASPTPSLHLIWDYLCTLLHTVSIASHTLRSLASRLQCMYESHQCYCFSTFYLVIWKHCKEGDVHKKIDGDHNCHSNQHSTGKGPEEKQIEPLFLAEKAVQSDARNKSHGNVHPQSECESTLVLTFLQIWIPPLHSSACSCGYDKYIIFAYSQSTHTCRGSKFVRCVVWSAEFAACMPACSVTTLCA